MHVFDVSHLPHLKHPLGADAHLVTYQLTYCVLLGAQETVLASTLGGRREEGHYRQLVGAGWEDLFLNVQ